MVNDDGVFTAHKGLGLVNEVFGREEMKNRSLSSRQGAVHLRRQSVLFICPINCNCVMYMPG